MVGGGLIRRGTCQLLHGGGSLLLCAGLLYQAPHQQRHQASRGYVAALPHQVRGEPACTRAHHSPTSRPGTTFAWPNFLQRDSVRQGAPGPVHSCMAGTGEPPCRHRTLQGGVVLQKLASSGELRPCRDAIVGRSPRCCLSILNIPDRMQSCRRFMLLCPACRGSEGQNGSRRTLPYNCQKLVWKGAATDSLTADVGGRTQGASSKEEEEELDETNIHDAHCPACPEAGQKAARTPPFSTPHRRSAGQPLIDFHWRLGVHSMPTGVCMRQLAGAGPPIALPQCHFVCIGLHSSLIHTRGVHDAHLSEALFVSESTSVPAPSKQGAAIAGIAARSAVEQRGLGQAPQDASLHVQQHYTQTLERDACCKALHDPACRLYPAPHRCATHQPIAGAAVPVHDTPAQGSHRLNLLAEDSRHSRRRYSQWMIHCCL